ncbi:MAG: ATP-binding protein [Pseudomonadota bacterium]|nr:ATP-binding protein [Pseudomonadota bacterium]
MLKSVVDPKSKAGLEKDIAELDELVDEILLASRLNAIEQPQISEEVDLLALTAEECSRYDEVQLEGAPIVLRGDARLLRRLVRNLLENAKRHGAPPTQVRLQREGPTVVLKVWDSGSGPAPAEFEQMFTPFYRRRDGRDKHRKRTGSVSGAADRAPPWWGRRLQAHGGRPGRFCHYLGLTGARAASW